MKKLLLLIATVLVVFQLQIAYALSDIQGYPYRDAIEYLEREGIISGYNDGTFKPNIAINRAELMKILVGSVADEEDYKSYGNCFPDVQEGWFEQYVCYAYAQGWIDGYPDGNFLPGNTVNKAEAIKMLINSQGIEVPKVLSEDVYRDVPSNAWFAPYINAAKSKGALVETGNYFYPGELMTRGSISENIYRVLLPQLAKVPMDTTDGVPVVWANEGGDKVTKDELRASKDADSVFNSVWDGQTIHIFGAKNEIVNFSLILESPNIKSEDVQVLFEVLLGPGGKIISSEAVENNDFFDWTERNIELFYIRYLEIKGLSAFMSGQYDQRHLPKTLQAPYDQYGIATGGWYERPNHNKLYPEIAVPLELEQGFDIPAGENQAIWADIYIPKNSSPGLYYGSITIQTETDEQTVPVELEVLDFVLPDTPTSKTMLVVGGGDINERYLGEKWPSGVKEVLAEEIQDKHFQLAHRHKISLIGSGDHYSEDRPNDAWIPRLDGTLFTAKNGYAGPGTGVGNGVYAIGIYGSWQWKGEGKASMHQHANGWETWFQEYFPDVEHFIYLIDESADYAQTQKWAKWIEETDGPGKNLPSMATIWLLDAIEKTPSLDIAASSMYVGDTEKVQDAADYFLSSAVKKLYFYNGGRPGQGSFMIDDDGIALRELAWGQFKKNIDRWFYWESTYYNNFQAGLGNTNVFGQAHTFGGKDRFDDSVGETGWNYSNGDGVLFYPGTDLVFPSESYGIDGPIASLRLKHWRRGIQDSDYLKLAMQKDSAATMSIIAKVIPKVLWEYGVSDPDDPTWVRTAISWSDDPDVWENARRELAEIILK